MALTPRDAIHKAQISAGTTGRNRGHSFEKALTEAVRIMDLSPSLFSNRPRGHLVVGNPAEELLRYVIHTERISGILRVESWWLGGLATSGKGDLLLGPDGKVVTGSKSDIVLRLHRHDGQLTRGVSVKTCSKKTPTNDQLYFTTASAFCELLRAHGLAVSPAAEEALKRFCGDPGFRPRDDPSCRPSRRGDPDRWFWEELPPNGWKELEDLLRKNQDNVTRILLQKAYPRDPYPPVYVLHQTVSFEDIASCPLALFTVDELVELSHRYAGFELRPYRIHKGRFKGDPNIHYAPRFGFVQFQRGGQKQHPTQLQFNLKAGYFNNV